MVYYCSTNTPLHLKLNAQQTALTRLSADTFPLKPNHADALGLKRKCGRIRSIRSPSGSIRPKEIFAGSQWKHSIQNAKRNICGVVAQWKHSIQRTICGVERIRSVCSEEAFNPKSCLRGGRIPIRPKHHSGSIVKLVNRLRERETKTVFGATL